MNKQNACPYEVPVECMRTVDIGKKVLSSVVCMRNVDKAALSAGSIDGWWSNINYFGII